MKIDIGTIREYKVIGIRGLTGDENYNIGDFLRNSYQWDYENDCSTFDTDNPLELNGACAKDTEIDTFFDEDEDIIEKINKILKDFDYNGDRVLVAGNDYEYGMDENELIISDAVVIHKFQKVLK